MIKRVGSLRASAGPKSLVALLTQSLGTSVICTLGLSTDVYAATIWQSNTVTPFQALAFKLSGPSVTDGDVVAQILSDSAGPNAVVASSATQHANALVNGWNTFDFSATPFTPVNGTSYWFALFCNAPGVAFNILGSPDPGASAQIKANGGGWIGGGAGLDLIVYG